MAPGVGTVTITCGFDSTAHDMKNKAERVSALGEVSTTFAGVGGSGSAYV